jgi:hypothetical protein
MQAEMKTILAMAASVASKLWEVSDIVALLDQKKSN